MYTNTNVFRYISSFPASKRNSNPYQKNPYLPKNCHDWELDPSNSSPVPLLTTKKFWELPKKQLGRFCSLPILFLAGERFLPQPSPPATAKVAAGNNSG